MFIVLKDSQSLPLTCYVDIQCCQPFTYIDSPGFETNVGFKYKKKRKKKKKKEKVKRLSPHDTSMLFAASLTLTLRKTHPSGNNFGDPA